MRLNAAGTAPQINQFAASQNKPKRIAAVTPQILKQLIKTDFFTLYQRENSSSPMYYWITIETNYYFI